MKFNYQARTKEGNLHAGSVEASSRDAAVAFLQRRGLYVTFLEDATPTLYAKEISFLKRTSKKEIVLFSRQLAIMFKSKVSLIESLKILGAQTKNSDFREKILKMSEDVEGGVVFSQALLRYPKLFSFFYVAMVRSGEASGKLSEVLNYLADHLERDYHLTAKAKGALVYPSLIVFVVILVSALLVFFVLPGLIEILEESGQELPLPTRILVSVIHFSQKWWWLILSLLALSIFSLARYRSSPEGRKFFDKMLLKTPFIGPFLQMIYLIRFAENLSTLISSGLHIVQSLEITADVIGSVPYKEAILETREKVKKGETVSSSLNQFPELFFPIFVQMVLVGERTGTMDTTLMNVVRFYQQEVDRTVDSLLSILEPFLIIFLGVVVGGIMLSILMPLYQTVAI